MSNSRAAQPPVIPEVGALRQWRHEIRDGKRTRHVTDAIWLAACLEARAREELREGLIGIANGDRREAAEIIIRAGLAERIA